MKRHQALSCWVSAHTLIFLRGTHLVVQELTGYETSLGLSAQVTCYSL